MIRIEDVQEAIAECEGQRNPNANTCLKLASLYTILNYKQKAEPNISQIPMYSYAAEPTKSSLVDYESNTEFGQLINGQEADRVFQVMDELMTTLESMIPRLYQGVLTKLDK